MSETVMAMMRALNTNAITVCERIARRPGRVIGTAALWHPAEESISANERKSVNPGASSNSN